MKSNREKGWKTRLASGGLQVMTASINQTFPFWRDIDMSGTCIWLSLVLWDLIHLKNKKRNRWKTNGAVVTNNQEARHQGNPMETMKESGSLLWGVWVYYNPAETHCDLELEEALLPTSDTGHLHLLLASSALSKRAFCFGSSPGPVSVLQMRKIYIFLSWRRRSPISWATRKWARKTSNYQLPLSFICCINTSNITHNATWLIYSCLPDPLCIENVLVLSICPFIFPSHPSIHPSSNSPLNIWLIG